MHRLIPALIAFFLLAAPGAWSAEDFLRPEQAFQVQARASEDGRSLVMDWTIAPGYYLYRDKLRVQPEDPAVQLGEPVYSPAREKQDPIFGAIQVYYDRARVTVPVLDRAGRDRLALRLRYQGCADGGICYPPQEHRVTVALPAEPVQAAAPAPEKKTANGDGFLAAPIPPGTPEALEQLYALNRDLGLDDGMDDDILPVDEAFRVSAESPDGKRLIVRWEIAEGTYLYQDQLKVRVGGDGVQIGPFTLPEPDIKKDSLLPDGSFGDVPVYHDRVELRIPLLRDTPGATEIEVIAGYQGCADRGICYPPQQKVLRVALPAIAPTETAPVADPGLPPPEPAPPAGRAAVPMPPATPPVSAPAPPADAAPAPAAPRSEQDRLFDELHDAGFWMALLLSLGFGVLVAFTACMYPMIPILSSLIMGQGEKVTPLRAFRLSLAYTQGIALTYGVLGVAMALVGKSLGIQSALQTPWVLVPSIVLFVALALSMFGFYQIQIPAALQSRLNELSNRQQGGSVLGVGLMGVISALIVGPCGGPVLLAVLAFAASSDDLVHGFLILWLFGTGMGLPLLVMGSGGGALLPRAGGWMDTVKAAGGVIMLALAISFLERMSPTYVPTSAIMLLWGTLLVVTAVYMGALRQLPEEGSGWLRLWKGLGLVLLIYGAAFVIGVAAGGRDTTQPLRGLFPAVGATGASEIHPVFRKVKGVAGLQRELEAARAAGRPVMLDFYADWCTYCKVMEKELFPDPRVQRALAGFVLLQADITAMDEDDKALLEHMQLPAPPALFFWDREGRLRPELRLVGEPTVEELVRAAAEITR